MALQDFLSGADKVRLSRIQEHVRKLYAAGMPVDLRALLYGPVHLGKVEQIAGDILGCTRSRRSAKDRLVIDSVEVFYLLAAVWLHDIGVVAREPGASYVQARAHELDLRPEEAGIVAQICEACHVTALASLDAQYPDVRLLSTVLAVARELDLTYERSLGTFESLWSNMSHSERFRWVAHQCVSHQRPSQILKKEGAASTLWLSYELVLSLPGPEFERPFWGRLLAPVKEVLVDRGANDVLRTKGLGIALDEFRRRFVRVDLPLPDGQTLEEFLSSQLMPPSFLPLKVVEVLEKLGATLPPGEAVLRAKAAGLLAAVAAEPDTNMRMRRLMSRMAQQLWNAGDAHAAEVEYAHFLEEGRKLARSLPEGKLASRLVSVWHSFATVTWRILCVANGNEQAQLHHLAYIPEILGLEKMPIMTDLAVDQHRPVSVRCKAIESLRGSPSPESYETIMVLARDPHPEVRRGAVKALADYPGFEAQQLLEELAATDADQTVGTVYAPLRDERHRASAGAKKRSRRKKFDVFLAHHSVDKPLVEEIARELKRRGIRPWIDTEQIPPGALFQDQLQEAIPQVRSAAIILGPTGLGKWQALELRTSISACVESGLPVIPVLLPGVEEVPPQLRFLREFSLVRFRKHTNEVNALDTLEWGITGVDPRSAKPLG